MEPGTLTSYEAGRSPDVAAASQIIPRAGRGSLAAALIGVLLWFGLLDHRPLIDPDEGRYAEIAREFLASGDWTTPRLNTLIYLEKPPLQSWATALAFKLVGVGNGTARLFPALAGLAGILLAAYAGRRLYSPLAGLYAALILASGLLYFAAGHFNSLDMALAFFTETAVFALALALHPGATPAEHGFWVHAMWVACALGVLTKGLVGLVLPFVALAIYSLVFRDYAVWKRLSPAVGAALFLLLTAPWFVAVALANSDFVRFFFVHEHFERFLTTAHHRYQPFWYFIPLLLVGTLPWTIPVLNGLCHGLRHPKPTSGFSPERFIAVWCVFVFAFFSVSQSKLSGYIVPVLPPLALLAGRYLCVVEAAALRRQLLPALAAPLALLAALLYITFLSPSGEDAARIASAAPYLVVAAALMAGAILYALLCVARSRSPVPCQHGRKPGAPCERGFYFTPADILAHRPANRPAPEGEHAALFGRHLPAVAPGLPRPHHDPGRLHGRARLRTPPRAAQGHTRPGDVSRRMAPGIGRHRRDEQGDLRGARIRRIADETDRGRRRPNRGAPVMNAATFTLIVAGVLLNAIAQLMLKAGASRVAPLTLEATGLLAGMRELVLSGPVFAGLACYILSVGIWLVALTRVEVSVAYPMLSLGYVVNAIAAWLLFGETLTPSRLAGILVILAGVYLLAGSARGS
jgi:4-amino-4-deoxy-L-arabinose transferase-like glycosyltransferase/multidrug transporter EmrE-like cation transporter